MSAEGNQTQEQTGTVADGKRAPVTFRSILGQKVGMTQVYGRRENRLFGVTVVKAGPCSVMRPRARFTLA